MRTCPRGRSWSAPSVQTRNAVNVTLTPGYKTGESSDFLRWDVNPEERAVMTAVNMDVRVTLGGSAGYFAWKRSQDKRYGQPHMIADHSSGPHSAIHLLFEG
jgi:hypothetical protein